MTNPLFNIKVTPLSQAIKFLHFYFYPALLPISIIPSFCSSLSLSLSLSLALPFLPSFLYFSFVHLPLHFHFIYIYIYIYIYTHTHLVLWSYRWETDSHRVPLTLSTLCKLIYKFLYLSHIQYPLHLSLSLSLQIIPFQLCFSLSTVFFHLHLYLLLPSLSCSLFLCKNCFLPAFSSFSSYLSFFSFLPSFSSYLLYISSHFNSCLHFMSLIHLHFFSLSTSLILIIHPSISLFFLSLLALHLTDTYPSLQPLMYNNVSVSALGVRTEQQKKKKGFWDHLVGGGTESGETWLTCSPLPQHKKDFLCY